MRASDVITNATKQNMNVMASTLNILCAGETKAKCFDKSKYARSFVTKNVPYILTKKMLTNT